MHDDPVAQSINPKLIGTERHLKQIVFAKVYQEKRARLKKEAEERAAKEVKVASERRIIE